jgi:hypothetical protein
VVADAIVTAHDARRAPVELDHETVVDRQSLIVPAEVFDSRVQLRWKAAQLGKLRRSSRRPAATSGRRNNGPHGCAGDGGQDPVLVADNFLLGNATS